MFKSLVLGAVLGGLTVFLWDAVSWMVLPWHMHALRMFEDEEQVAQVLTANAPESGVYVLPNALHAQSDTHPEMAEKARVDAVARMKRGPFAFVAVTREGVDPTRPDQYGYALAVNVASALLVTWLLLQTQGLGYLRRIWFVTVAGVLIGTAGQLPDWIWWHFSDSFIAIGFADAVAGWLLAGVVIARFATGRRSSLPTFR